MTILTTPASVVVPSLYNGIQHREASIEHLDPDRGTIVLRAVPYNHETELAHELFESFAPAAFARAVNAPSRCKLWMGHSGPLIGHATSVEDRPDGVWIQGKFSNTPSAQEARELASDGTLDQCSITFRPSADHMRVSRQADGLHVRHSKAGLMGCALVAHGAYDVEAYVASVRDADADREREARIAALRALDH